MDWLIRLGYVFRTCVSRPTASHLRYYKRNEYPPIMIISAAYAYFSCNALALNFPFPALHYASPAKPLALSESC